MGVEIGDLERALTARGLSATRTQFPGELKVVRPGQAGMLGETITFRPDGWPYWSWGERIHARGLNREHDESPAYIAERIDLVVTFRPVSNSA